MPGPFERNVSIDAPAQKVFEYLADFTRHPEWAGTPLEITGEGPFQAGATFTSTGKQFGTHKDQVRIVELSPPGRIVYESTGDAGVIRHTLALSEEGGTTRLSKVFELVKPKFPTGLFARIAPGAFTKGLDKDVRSIKTRVEGSAL